MKQYLPLLLILFSLCSNAQVAKIKVKKETDCDFKIIPDSSIKAELVILSHYSTNGISAKEFDNTRMNLRYVRMTHIYLHPDSLNKKYSTICETKKYKLKSVTFIKVNDPKPMIDTAGVSHPFVRVDFLYERKKRK